MGYLNRKIFQAFFLSAILIISVEKIQAQTLNADTLKTQFLRDWARAKDYTLDYLKTMPADKYGLKPADSIRNFAQQMLHLAQVNAVLISMATGQQMILGDRGLTERLSAQSKDSVTYYVNTSYDFVIKSIQSLDASKFIEMVGENNRKLPRYVLIMKTFEHQTHHRGQTTIYIRLAGVKPPNERLF